MKTMLLEEAIRQKIVTVGNTKKRVLGDYIKYELDIKQCVVPQELTGWKEKQQFRTELLNWRLEKVSDKVLLIADEATEAQLWLQGKIGYEHGIEAINYICRTLYLNYLADEAIAMTERTMKSGVSPCKKEHWLGSLFTNTDAGYTYFGMRVALSSGYVSGTPLYSSHGTTNSNCHSVRLVIFLKSNVQVVISEESKGSKEKPWQLIKGSSYSSF